MNRVRPLRRVVVIGACMVLGLALFVSPAAADHQEPFDGPQHDYGEMVDYPLAFPVEGPGYWYEDWFWAPRTNGDHHAQDIMAPKMTPVLAAAAGTITWINWSQNPSLLNPDRCCTLVVTHDDGWETWYIHLNNDTPGTDDGEAWGIAPGIALGTRVDAGQLIGWVGDSGNAEETPPHLHFELHDPDGVIVNPYDSLRAAEGEAFCSVATFPYTEALMATTEVLRRGSSGILVTQLQQALSALGFEPGGVDGVFGPKTEAAVRAFQADRDIAADGIVGSQTRGALKEFVQLAPDAIALDPDGRLLGMGSVGGDVERVQRLLSQAGYEPGPIDGVFGPFTAGAVRAFQEDAGITVDGLVGRGTRASLTETLGLTGLVSCDG